MAVLWQCCTRLLHCGPAGRQHHGTSSGTQACSRGVRFRRGMGSRSAGAHCMVARHHGTSSGTQACSRGDSAGSMSRGNQGQRAD